MLTKLRSKHPKLSRAQRLYLDRNVVLVGVTLGVYAILMVCVLGISRCIQEGVDLNMPEEEQLLELSLGGWNLCHVRPGEIVRAGMILILFA